MHDQRRPRLRRFPQGPPSFTNIAVGRANSSQMLTSPISGSERLLDSVDILIAEDVVPDATCYVA